MINALIFVLAQTMTPAPAPLASPPPTPTPAPYKAAPCNELVKRAHLDKKQVDADGIGKLLAQALRDHGYTKGGSVSQMALGRAVIDTLGCFKPAKK